MSGPPATVLIVDDEAPARSRLRQLVAELPPYTVIGEAAHGEEALALCGRLEPDVVLLDIRMPGLDGLAVAGQLAGWARRPAVVFTTAYDAHAVQAFEAQAVGYLLKPVRRERLQQALDHAARIGRSQLRQLRGTAPRRHLCVPRGRGIALVPIDEVLCFHADQKYVTVRHVGGEALLSEPLKDLETEFGDRFVRSHRNALVACDWIEALERRADGGWQLRLRGGHGPLPVSRRHLAGVKRRIGH
jgi:two-component system response regulator AlgR